MEIFLIVAIVVMAIIIAVFYGNFKTKITELEHKITVNKELTEINISKSVKSVNSRLDNAAKTIKADQRQIAENKQKISDVKQEIESIKEPIADFIASKKLNADEYNPDNDIKSDLDVAAKLDDEQLSAYTEMNNSNSNIFITGKAGTGKSYLLRNFVKNTDKNVLVLAPTGVAALNVGGVTIHSAFGWHNLNELNIDEITADSLYSLNNDKRHILRKSQTVIIDEISMVRADVFEKIDKIFRILNNKDLPFGGKQIIVFGDLFQLPPIAKGKERDYLNDTFGGIYFFNSNAYKNGSFKFIELVTNHRQKTDKVFFDILNNIREGTVSDADLKTLNKRIVPNEDTLDKTIIRLFPKKEKARSINNKELDNINEKEYRFTWSVEQKKPLTAKQVNDALNDMPVSETLCIKKGAVVMLVNNDVNGRWVNGTLAIVGDIHDNYIEVIKDGKIYMVGKASFEYNEPVYKDGKIKYETVLEVTQFPLILAYAITIHKSQGMTYQQIAVDVSKSFAPGQVYVALSRCVNMDGLNLLSAVKKENLAVEPDVLNFYKSLTKNK